MSPPFNNDNKMLIFGMQTHVNGQSVQIEFGIAYLISITTIIEYLFRCWKICGWKMRWSGLYLSVCMPYSM